MLEAFALIARCVLRQFCLRGRWGAAPGVLSLVANAHLGSSFAKSTETKAVAQVAAKDQALGAVLGEKEAAEKSLQGELVHAREGEAALAEQLLSLADEQVVLTLLFPERFHLSKS